MAYRRGGRGGRGDLGRGGGSGEAPPYRPATGFVWPPPGMTPRPGPPPPQYPQPGPPAVVYRAPMLTPHQAAYQPVAAPVVYRAASPVPLGGYARSTPVTIRAPPPSHSPAPAPYQPAKAAAPAPSSCSSAPSAAALAKEVEQKLFVPAGEAAVATDKYLAPVSKKGLAPPAWPGYGAAGKKVMIRANHFLVNVADNSLFHYDVSINPESKSRATNREVLNELIKLRGKTSLGGKLPAYDGRKSLYTAGSLPFESEEFVVKLIDPEKKDKERAEREYKITIRIAGRTDLYHLQQFLLGRQRDMPQETIQVLDVVLRESPSWNYVTVSRSFFSTQFGHQGDIGEGLECWRGYYQSLRPTQMGLSLNIDISATSFFKPVTVIQFVEEFLNIRDTARPLSDRDRVKIKKALRGVLIETKHQEDQIRRYKITGITPIPMSQLIFPVDDNGTRMTVVQYFWDRYSYRLKYAFWPCLQSGSDSHPVYLPMEVCKIVQGQRYSKKLDDKQVTNILRATCQRPQQREQSVHEMVLHNKYTEDRFAQEFGIKVCNDLVSVPAHVLPPPMLKYHDSRREKTCAPSVGQWNMINKLKYHDSEREKTCAPSGQWNMVNKKIINGGTVDNWAYLNFSRMPLDDVTFLSEVPTIIFGADVTHPQHREDSASSIASVVASMDWPEITKYQGLVSAQSHEQEIIEDLFSVGKHQVKGISNGGMIRELLIAFREKTGRRPERIIFYRDGVSEDHFSHVLLHEMDAIRKACASLEEGYLPPVTFVVVQKRHHTRLFPEVHGRRDMTDKSGNICPGTMVDHQICHPTKSDCYVCSHTGIQGTCKSTHHRVLYDENHFKADALQSLTNNLCDTYAQCTCAVSEVKTTPNVNGAENSITGSIPGKSGQAVAEGATTVFHQNRGINVCAETTNFKVCFLLGKQHYIVDACNDDYISTLIDRAKEQARFWPKDVYYTTFRCKLHTKATVKECSLSRGSIISVQSRLRGGGEPNADKCERILSRLVQAKKIPLLDHIRCLKGANYWVEWFELVRLPSDVMKNPNSGFGVLLSEKATHIAKLFALCLERSHASGNCFGGNFRLKDVYYVKKFESIEINVAEVPFSSEGYIADWMVYKEFLDCHCKWNVVFSREWRYPIYFADLAAEIVFLKEAFIAGSREIGYLWRERSVLFQHVALESSERRVQIVAGLLSFYHDIPSEDKHLFITALGTCSSWKSDAMCVPVMKARIDYNDDYVDHEVFSQLNLCRQVFTHGSKPGQISKKQLDVAIGNLYRYHLPRVQRKLMVRFDSDQVKAKKLSPSGTNAMYSVHKVFGHTFIGEDYVPIVRASKDVKEGKRPAEPPKKKLPESSSKKVKR